jgi:hypothetical protein
MSLAVALSVLGTASPIALHAQGFTTDDPVIRQMWVAGMEESQTEALAQVLMDSIGPRWSGTPNLTAAENWLLRTYASWGVPARKEQYRTFPGWDQGILHVDLIAPRVQSLEAKMWVGSPSTGGPVEGDVVALPMIALRDSEPSQWLPLVHDKWLLISPPEPTCRPDQNLEKLARPETVERLKAIRDENNQIWRSLWRDSELLEEAVVEAGALGTIVSQWSGGWGTFKVFNVHPDHPIPLLVLSCEDYGLVYRLTENDQKPKLRVEAEAEKLGDVPQFNVIAELKGAELPDEYVVLSAHLDSFTGGTGATDNGTGTIMMLEAMRILKETYPNPRRTILVGHWGAEEFDFGGSRGFRDNHPEVVEGMQALFNQDNGTWRIDRIGGQGFLYAGQYLGRWLSLVPRTISEHIKIVSPGGVPGGSDHLSFVCVGAPAFTLGRLSVRNGSPTDDYRQYTHHTNRDTYDKIVFDDLKENATLVAMLANHEACRPAPVRQHE